MNSQRAGKRSGTGRLSGGCCKIQLTKGKQPLGKRAVGRCASVCAHNVMARCNHAILFLHMTSHKKIGSIFLSPPSLMKRCLKRRINNSLKIGARLVNGSVAHAIFYKDSLFVLIVAMLTMENQLATARAVASRVIMPIIAVLGRMLIVLVASVFVTIAKFVPIPSTNLFGMKSVDCWKTENVSSKNISGA